MDKTEEIADQDSTLRTDEREQGEPNGLGLRGKTIGQNTKSSLIHPRPQKTAYVFVVAAAQGGRHDVAVGGKGVVVLCGWCLYVQGLKLCCGTFRSTATKSSLGTEGVI